MSIGDIQQGHSPTDAGVKVVGLERGAYRDTHPDFDMPGVHDEYKYTRKFELIQDRSRETITFRNAPSETALPMRQLGSFLPGEGLGGAGALFSEAARSLGQHPFPMPSANMTRGNTNPYGLTMGPCAYCGYCAPFGCEMGAKSSPQTTVLPALLASSNYELRTLANVVRVNLDSDRRRAVSVTYVDARGRGSRNPLISCCSLLSCSTRCDRCSSPESASLTTRSRTRAWLAATTPTNARAK